MTTEMQWNDDRERFIGDDADQRRRGAADDGSPATSRVQIEVGPLAEQFADLARSLFTADTVAGVLDCIVRATLEITPGCDLASVTLRDPDGGFTTPVYTDAVAERIDQAQYAVDEGPCLEATRADGLGVALCTDLAADTEQWPLFSPRAAGMGVGAMLGVGLFPHADPPRLGALNIYSSRAHGLDRTDRDVALILASHASVALARTMEVQSARLEAAQLTEALQSRDVIGQAKGILMERRGIDAGAAFDVLRRASQDLNVKLSDIAGTLAAHRSEL